VPRSPGRLVRLQSTTAGHCGVGLCYLSRMRRSALIAAIVLATATAGGCGQSSPGTNEAGVPLAPGVSMPIAIGDSYTMLVEPGDVIAVFSTASAQPRSYDYAVTVEPIPSDVTSLDLPYETVYSPQNRGSAVAVIDSPTQTAAIDTEQQPAQVGDREQFWVPKFSDIVNDVDGALEEVTEEVTAVLRASGEYADVYIDVASQLTDADAAAIAQQFDEVAWPIVTNQFGNPPTPGGRERIAILLSPTFNGGKEDELNERGFSFGMFNDRDQLPDSPANPKSNYRNVLHLNPFALISTDTRFVDPDKWRSILSHEFQHMVNYNYHQDREAVPIDEGKAMLSEILSGFGLPTGDPTMASNVVAYQLEPASVSLLQTTYGDNPVATYGMGLLWVSYLYDRFGSDVLLSIATHPEPGILGASAVTGFAPDVLFVQWVQANLVTSITDDPTFRYEALELSGNSNGSYAASLPGFANDSSQHLTYGTTNHAIPSYGVEYFRATQQQLVRVTGNNVQVLLFRAP